MAILFPNNSQTAGVPAQWEDTINANDVALITGDLPGVVTEDLIFAASQTIPALTPVGFNDAGTLVPALRGSVAPEDDIVPVGITIVAITAAVSTAKGAPIYRAGVFNPLALNWPASYTTEAQKLAAFHGAPTPTNIIMRRPKTYTV